MTAPKPAAKTAKGRESAFVRFADFVARAGEDWADA